MSTLALYLCLTLAGAREFRDTPCPPPAPPTADGSLIVREEPRLPDTFNEGSTWVWTGHRSGRWVWSSEAPRYPLPGRWRHQHASDRRSR